MIIRRGLGICSLLVLLSLRQALAEEDQGVSTISHPPFTTPREPRAFTLLNGTVSFDLYERVRWEDRNNNYDFDSSKRALTDDNWFLTRFRFGMKWQPTNWFTFYVQGQDAREFLSDRADIPGVSGAEGNDSFDLRQAYIELRGSERFPFVLKAGRQTMEYGDERLIGRSTWNNFGRTFDAVRFSYEPPKWRIDAFISSVVVVRRGDLDQSDLFNGNGNDRQQIFSGLYTTRETAFGSLDLYALWLSQANSNNSNTQGNLPSTRPLGDIPDAQHTSFGTFGGRLRGEPQKEHGFEWEIEGAYQNGEVRDLTLSAFAVHAGLGYNFDTVWKPRIWAEYNFATGDDNPDDGKIGTFQNLFPSNHRFYGYMDLFSWQNLHNPEISVRVNPTKNLSTQLDFHAFFLADTNDAWYRNNGITMVRPLNAAARQADNFVGTELDFTCIWNLNKRVAIQFGYSHFFAGAYLAQTGPSDDADFGYFMTTINL